MLAYLWQRDQDELVAEMIGAGVDAVLVKTASMGLDPHRHLGRSISELQARARLCARVRRLFGFLR